MFTLRPSHEDSTSRLVELFMERVPSTSVLIHVYCSKVSFHLVGVVTFSPVFDEVPGYVALTVAGRMFHHGCLIVMHICFCGVNFGSFEVTAVRTPQDSNHFAPHERSKTSHLCTRHALRIAGIAVIYVGSCRTNHELYGYMPHICYPLSG